MGRRRNLAVVGGTVRGSIRRRLLGGVVLAAVAATLSPGAGTGATAAQPQLVCQAFGVAPAGQSGLSAMCVRADITRDSQTQEETSRVVHVTVSHDGGRTWTEMKALGLPPIPAVDAPPPNSGGGYVEAEGTVPDEVIYSAGYGNDHTIYLSVYGQITGLYKTTDEGDTWTFSTPIVGNDIGGPFLAYADPRPGPAGTTLSAYPVALANRLNPERFDGPFTTREKGADPAWTRQLVNATRSYHGTQLVGVAEVEDPASYFAADIASVRSCTLDLDCSHVLHTFPPSSTLGPLVLAGDFGTSGRMFVEEHSTNPQWRKSLGWLESTDGGHSFHSWAFAAKVTRDIARVGGAQPDIVVATNPQLPRVVVADVSYSSGTGSRERVYVSRDDGRHWTASRDVRRPSTYEWFLRTVTLAPDGNLFLLAPLSPNGPLLPQQDTFTPKQAMWCSSDYGRTWGFTCR